MTTPVTAQLSERDELVLAFVVGYTRHRGFPPTVREVGEAVGLSSTSSAAAVIDRLVRIGVLRREPKVPRSLVVVDGAAL